jgi:hypothetical protein
MSNYNKKIENLWGKINDRMFTRYSMLNTGY